MDEDMSYDGPTLRQALEMASRSIDLGAAVLPRPLFEPDDNVEAETPLSEGPEESVVSGKSREGTAPVISAKADRKPTTYATVLRTEFNAIVVEHHLKWAPLCVSTNNVCLNLL